jgi:hypothetical protein
MGTTASAGWPIGLALGIVVILVAAAIVIEVVRRQTAALPGIARINDSGVRILHAARSLRKVAVGK